MQILRKTLRFLFAAIAASTVHLRASAVEVLPGLDIHSYGDAGYVRECVSPQSFCTTTEHDLALLGSYQVSGGGRVWAQVAHTGNADRLRLDLLFFDGEIDARTTARIGQARLPVCSIQATQRRSTMRCAGSPSIAAT